MVCVQKSVRNANARTAQFAQGPVGIPITGRPPVTGIYRFPPTGMPNTGNPPNAGRTSCGALLGIGGLESAGGSIVGVVVAAAVGVGHTEPSARTHFVGVDTQAGVIAAAARIAQPPFMAVFSMWTYVEFTPRASGERAAVDYLIAQPSKVSSLVFSCGHVVNKVPGVIRLRSALAFDASCPDINGEEA
jgi:hypothetical protein